MGACRWSILLFSWRLALFVPICLSFVLGPQSIQQRRPIAPTTPLFASSRKSQVRWLIHTALDKLEEEDDASDTCKQTLRDSLLQLDRAHTVTEVSSIGRQLSTVNIPNCIVQDVLQIASIAGIHSLAYNLTDRLLENGVVPTKSSQILLFQTLRKLQRVSRMKQYVGAFSQVGTLNVQAFNMYLATLGEMDPPQLDSAWEALQNSTVYDDVSYSTVLQMAAQAKNATLSDAVWNALLQNKIVPNNFALDGRLKSLSSAKKLQCWDAELIHSTRLDSFAVDALLLPFVESDRNVNELLDRFCRYHSDTKISEGFTQFLLTLVDSNELEIARYVVDTYILPSLQDVVMGDRLRFVLPDIRHFNTLLNGYKNHQQHEKAWELFKIIQSKSLLPDSYTISIMMCMCRNSTEVTSLIQYAVFNLPEFNDVSKRASLKAYCETKDPSSAVWLFVCCSSNTTRFWNALLRSLATVNATEKIDPVTSLASQALGSLSQFTAEPDLERFLVPSTVYGTVCSMLNAMIAGQRAPEPDSQTFCVASMTIQHSPDACTALAAELFQNATRLGIPADGRFVNAALRCCKDDIEGAIKLWRDEIRPHTIKHDRRARTRAPSGKNLLSAYHGLLYVCGRAVRPNVALRLIYAIRKEGFEPNEVCLNSYWRGRLVAGRESDDLKSKLVRKLTLVEQYESLLYVECTKYDTNDRRRKEDKRVRIIV